MKTLSKERIAEIVDRSDNVHECLLKLFKEVLLPISWDDIENIRPWGIHINRTTSEFILQAMHEKFTGKDGDPWTVNGLILNKGFSGQHDDLNDWEVRIADYCYTLKS